MAARSTSPKRSPFAAVADTLTNVLVSTMVADHAAAFDLLEVARAWPHYVKGERRPRPGHEGWIVEIQSRRRLSKAEFRDWLTQADQRREEREREAERRGREEAKATAEREAEDRARIRRAMTVIAAAQAAAPPGPRAAYVYNEGENKAELVPIVARAGVLFVRKSEKGAGYTIIHEPTGLGLAAPAREEVKTQTRALELLERAARPAVLAALSAALRRRKGREAIEEFYTAWAADHPHAAEAPPARRRERSASPFAAAAGALAAPPGSCARRNGSGTVQDGEVTVYCTCALGQQLHDRELALAWAPAETERIVQFLDRRAAAEEDDGARRALKAAARALRESGDIRDKAATHLLRAASKGSAAARAALRAAADELARGAHLPPAPLPATAAEMVATYESRDGTSAMQAIDALEAALARGEQLDLRGPLRVGFLGLLNDALTRGDPEVWQMDEALYALRQTIETTPAGLTGPSTTANAKPLKRLRTREASLLGTLLAGRARHAAVLAQRAPRVFALYRAEDSAGGTLPDGRVPKPASTAAAEMSDGGVVAGGASAWRAAAAAVVEPAVEHASRRSVT